MNELLEQAIQAIRKLPPARQNQIAESLVMITSDQAREYTPEQIAAMHEGVNQANAGNFVSEQELLSLFAKYRNV